MFIKRLKHWTPDADEKDFKWFICVMKELAGYKAWNLCISYLTSIFNCWHTSTRLGNSPLPCLLGCVPYIGPCREFEYNNWDSLGHYLCCPVIHQIHRRLLPELNDNRGARFRLGLGRFSIVQDFCEALFLDGVHAMYNHVAHSAMQLSLEQMYQLTRSRMGASIEGKTTLRAFVDAVVLWN